MYTFSFPMLMPGPVPVAQRELNYRVSGVPGSPVLYPEMATITDPMQFQAGVQVELWLVDISATGVRSAPGPILVIEVPNGTPETPGMLSVS